jgi:hypothetical protein
MVLAGTSIVAFLGSLFLDEPKGHMVEKDEHGKVAFDCCRVSQRVDSLQMGRESFIFGTGFLPKNPLKNTYGDI